MAPSTDRQTFRETVAAVAEKARARLPQAVNGRIESAVKLVLTHDVVFHEDGTILVGSSTDPLKVYRLTGAACECQDFAYGQAPDGWCQHRIAAGIQKRVQELLAAPVPVEPETVPEAFPDNDPEPAPASPAVPRPLPEAAFSLTLKGTLDGQEALLTARGQTAAEFKRNLEAIRRLLDPVATPVQASSMAEGWCSKHAVQMKLTTKDGHSWWSHKTPEGWCKGKV